MKSSLAFQIGKQAVNGDTSMNRYIEAVMTQCMNYKTLRKDLLKYACEGACVRMCACVTLGLKVGAFQ